MTKAFLLIDSRGKWLGIHKDRTRANWHMTHRKKMFPTVELKIEEVIITSGKLKHE